MGSITTIKEIDRKRGELLKIEVGCSKKNLKVKKKEIKILEF